MSVVSCSTTTTTAYKVTADTTGTLVLQTGATPTTAVTIDTSQNVGIGTASPSVKTDILGGANTALRIASSSSVATTAGAAYCLFGGSNNINSGYLGYVGVANQMTLMNGLAGELTFGTSNAERMRIDSSGNVGIGMTPTYKLDVTGSIRTSGVAYVAGGDGSIQRSGGNTWIMVSSNTGYGSNGVHLKLDSSTTAGFFGFYSQGTSILEAAGAGNTVVLQGGSTSAGTGIAFPATQNASANANTLDDYEEGTWTPSLGGNTTYSEQAGSYTKVGRMVIASFAITVSSIGTGSVNSISGLPFTVGGTSYGQGGQVGYYASLANSVVNVTLRVDLGATSISIAGSTAANATINAALTIFGNSARLLGSVVYQST